MKTKFEIFITAYRNAYKLEEKKYVLAKIYSANGDVKKRWYIYYSVLNPETGKMERQPLITMSLNQKYKTFRERMFHFKELQESINEMLENGYSPYQNELKDKDYFPAKKVILEALEVKFLTLKETAKADYKSRINQFVDYLENKGISQMDVRNFDRKVITDYLEIVLKKSSARNRNNTKAVLSSIFSVLLNKGIIQNNFIPSIEKLKTNSRRDKTIRTDDLQRILDELERTDPLLLFYVEFISYFFLRPIEVNRLRVRDVNLIDKVVTVEIKQKSYKTKIIPDLIFDKIQKAVDGKKKEMYLFTPNGVDYSSVKQTNRRDYFSKRFLKVKQQLGLNENYTLYSFRHTFVTKVYKELRKTYDSETAIQKLKLITGHESNAVHQYIHYIDADLPDDYSEFLK